LGGGVRGLTWCFTWLAGGVFCLREGERDGGADQVEGVPLLAGGFGEHGDSEAGAGEADRSGWWSRSRRPGQVHLEREPVRVHQESDLELRIDRALLAHPADVVVKPVVSVVVLAHGQLRVRGAERSTPEWWVCTE